MPDPQGIEARDDDLRRFIVKVRDYSSDGWLRREAHALIVLYGNPDVAKPQGLINANAETINVVRQLDDAETPAALEQARPYP